MPAHPSRAPLALGDGLVLDDKTFGRLFEGLFVPKLAALGFADQLEIPVLRHVFRVGQAFLFGRRAVIAAVEVGRALPVAGIGPPVEVDLST